MDNAGSLEHDGIHVVGGRTFIFANRNYTVSCEGIVIAWEFCYRVFSGVSTEPVTFFPSIWMPSEANGALHYTLIQSTPITFTPAQVDNSTNNILCPRVNLSATEQITAPAESVVGLYSFRRRNELELLRTNKAQSSITTYQFDGNQSIVQVIDSDVDYNIALRVHLGMPVYIYIYINYIIKITYECTRVEALSAPLT